MNISSNTKGELVIKVQRKLAELGFDPGPIDGNYGENTRDAVIRFQEDKELKPDGVIGPICRAKLGIDLSTLEPEAERELFRLMLLSNPNYFGNLPDSQFKPVKSISSNTFYEKLVCVGYHPQQKELEAVVHVYQPSGYGTDVCGVGTPEFIRFYLSFDNGVNWYDQGMTSFQVYNIPEGTEDEKHLEFAASLPVDPKSKICWSDPLIRVRAVLSWNNPPPPNQPNWPPIWGNIIEKSILVEPVRLIPMPVFLEEAQVQLPFPLEKVVDMAEPIMTKAKSLNVEELAELYKDKGVPVHRFAFKEIMAFTSGSTMSGALKLSAISKDFEINSDIIEQLQPLTDGDTSYEELTCIALDPNTPNTMVGVIHVKKPAGYSGNPCSDGSREYVTFWADFDGNGNFETCLGTADVQVYDVNNIPPDGIYYAVRLHVDLEAHRQDCKKGPKVVRIRAILSWNTPVSCTDPNNVPRWGNREETLINISPEALEPAGRIAILGNVGVGYIDNTSGLTISNVGAKFADDNTQIDELDRACPFGGKINVIGLPLPGWSYMVEVSPDNLIWTPLVADLELIDAYGNPTITNKADPVTKRYSYQASTLNANNLLAVWNSAGEEGKWFVRLTPYVGGIAQTADTHVIQLDNTWPERSITITTGPGNCGKFPIETLLEGKFVARDDYFDKFSLYVAPNVNDPGEAIPDPNSGVVETSVSPGDDWELDTTGMIACGYTVHVKVWDRAIVNNGKNRHWRHESVGFCLEAPVVESEK